MLFKKTISFITILMMFSNSVFAGDRIVVCSEPTSEDFYPVGDTAGHFILTKRTLTRDCNVTETVQGACIKWKNENTIQSIPQEIYSTYDESDYADSIGSLFSALNAYDQLNHVWSGFSGYCVSGTLRDFDWASDPMFWSSIAMGYVMAGGAGDKGSAAFKEVGKTVVKDSTKNEIAKEATEQYLKQTGTQYFSSATQQFVNTAMEQSYENMGKCLVSGTYNLATTTADYINNVNDSGSEEDCNPIDEICDDGNDEPTDSDIQTMDVQAFDDMVQTMSENGDTDISQYIDIIDDGSETGIVSFKFKSPSDIMDGSENMEVANDLREKMAKTQAIISGAVAAGGMAACMGTGASFGSVVNANTQEDSNRDLVQTSLNTGIDLAAKFAGPYGPAIAAVAKVVVALAMSYQSVDSCHNEDDAKKLGTRHDKTRKSLAFNLCRPMWDMCEDKFTWGKCALTGFHYCCYDQLLTKVLVTQIKAELGREWTNCTGISLSDLNYVSFRQCTDTEMQDGIDGAHSYGISLIPGRSSSAVYANYDGPIWDPTQAFQYKHKCMDLSEFKDYLQGQIGETIDPDSFSNYWNDMVGNPL